MAAGTAQNRELIEFRFGPNIRVVAGELGMTLVTREPFAAAFELQRDDVVCAVIMRAPRLWIDIDAVDLNAVDNARHDTARSRGQINTSTDPTSQHATITTKPVLNEPVR